MSLRYPGGLITKTPVTPSTSSAPGIWTMEQALEYIKAGTWPTTGDPYFEYVTMLLHGDGTNGAQNNTFLDSSTNAFSITRNGNTTQGSFSPFSRADGNWSNYFDGTGDYLTTPNVAALRLGSGDFTVEAWINPSVLTNTYGRPICGTYEFAGGADRGWLLQLNATGYLQFIVFPGSGGAATANVVSSTITPANVWSHVAVSRSGSSIKLYLNGVEVGSATSSFDDTYAGTSLYVASYFSTGGIGAAGYSFIGNISNVRVVKGTAVYTSAFTPPTTPLTAITNTSLLTCQSNRFIDNSTNAFAITPAGNTSVQVFNPFNPTAAYSTSTNGGSGYFDGSGDYLDAPANTAFDLGSGNFTIEMWVNTNRTADSWVTGYYVGNPSTASSIGYLVWINAGNWQFDLVSGNTETLYTVGTTAAISNNAWHHIACTRDGNTVRVFLDGALVSTNTYTSTLNNPGSAVYRVGGNSGLYEDPYAGYISNLRVVKGTAVYTAAFTPPTSPPTNITNTSLLLNFTNAGIFDNAAMGTLETAGNAQVSTAQKQFGTGSMYFDGTGDNLISAPSQDYSFGTGDYTIEGWGRLAATNLGYPVFFTIGTANSTGGTVLGMAFGDSGYAYRLALILSGSYIDLSAAGITQSTFGGVWKHWAVTRSGTTLNVYVDGSRVYTASNSTNLSGTYTLRIGGMDAFFWNGYIDEFRITKGYARYTGTTYTVPTAAFPNL